MKNYENLILEVKDNLKWYAEIEGIKLDPADIITDFLSYWFNDGKETMAYNMSNKQVEKDFNDPANQWLFYKTKKAREKQYKQYLYDEFNRFIWLITNTLHFINDNYTDLVNYKLIENDGKSIFGLNLWKNGIDLKAKMLKFAEFENIKLC